MKKLNGWIDVDIKKIRSLMNEGISFQKIARMEDMPLTVLYRIRDGVNVKRFYRQKYNRNRKQLVGFCTICRRNPLPEGHRYFCMECFRTAESGEISPELKLHL